MLHRHVLHHVMVDDRVRHHVWHAADVACDVEVVVVVVMAQGVVLLLLRWLKRW